MPQTKQGDAGGSGAYPKVRAGTERVDPAPRLGHHPVRANFRSTI